MMKLKDIANQKWATRKNAKSSLSYFDRTRLIEHDHKGKILLKEYWIIYELKNICYLMSKT